LNQTSALVYQLCDGKHSVSDISRELSRKLKQPVTEDLVWLVIDQLKQDNLLSNSEELNIKFDGLSRREVIRKVGFASMIALPVISSLIAPTAAMAQSGCEGGTCKAAGCFSGLCAATLTNAACSLNAANQGCCNGTAELVNKPCGFDAALFECVCT
jgi:hypothetical protein